MRQRITQARDSRSSRLLCSQPWWVPMLTYRAVPVRSFPVRQGACTPSRIQRFDKPRSITQITDCSSPLPIRKLSGFMSLCRKPFLCNSSTRSSICKPAIRQVLIDSFFPRSWNRSSRDLPSSCITSTLLPDSVVIAKKLGTPLLPASFLQIFASSSSRDSFQLARSNLTAQFSLGLALEVARQMSPKEPVPIFSLTTRFPQTVEPVLDLGYMNNESGAEHCRAFQSASGLPIPSSRQSMARSKRYCWSRVERETCLRVSRVSAQHSPPRSRFRFFWPTDSERKGAGIESSIDFTSLRQRKGTTMSEVPSSIALQRMTSQSSPQSRCLFCSPHSSSLEMDLMRCQRYCPELMVCRYSGQYSLGLFPGSQIQLSRRSLSVITAGCFFSCSIKSTPRGWASQYLVDCSGDPQGLEEPLRDEDSEDRPHRQGDAAQGLGHHPLLPRLAHSGLPALLGVVLALVVRTLRVVRAVNHFMIVLSRSGKLLLGCYSRRHDYFKVLGLSRKADSSEVKRAFYRCAKLYHPDSGPEKSEVRSLQVKVQARPRSLQQTNRRDGEGLALAPARRLTSQKLVSQEHVAAGQGPLFQSALRIRPEGQEEELRVEDDGTGQQAAQAIERADCAVCAGVGEQGGDRAAGGSLDRRGMGTVRSLYIFGDGLPGHGAGGDFDREPAHGRHEQDEEGHQSEAAADVQVHLEQVRDHLAPDHRVGEPHCDAQSRRSEDLDVEFGQEVEHRLLQPQPDGPQQVVGLRVHHQLAADRVGHHYQLQQQAQHCRRRQDGLQHRLYPLEALVHLVGRDHHRVRGRVLQHRRDALFDPLVVHLQEEFGVLQLVADPGERGADRAQSPHLGLGKEQFPAHLVLVAGQHLQHVDHLYPSKTEFVRYYELLPCFAPEQLHQWLGRDGQQHVPVRLFVLVCLGLQGNEVEGVHLHEPRDRLAVVQHLEGVVLAGRQLGQSGGVLVLLRNVVLAEGHVQEVTVEHHGYLHLVPIDCVFYLYVVQVVVVHVTVCLPGVAVDRTPGLEALEQGVERAAVHQQASTLFELDVCTDDALQN